MSMKMYSCFCLVHVIYIIVEYCCMSERVFCLQVHGMSLLLIAAEKSDLGICRLCISSGRSDINITNNKGKTALILAAERGNLDIVGAILERDEVVITEAQDVRKYLACFTTCTWYTCRAQHSSISVFS